MTTSKSVELERISTDAPSYDTANGNTTTSCSGAGASGPGTEVFRALKIRLWKDCLVLSLAWLLLYMGYNSMAAVQSSLNSAHGLGVTTMCVEFATMTLGNLFTDSSIMKRLGCKWTIALGMGMYSVYMSANFFPSFYTMVPMAAISGFTSAAMWVAQSTYLSRLGMSYGQRLGFDPDKYKGRFLGILYMAYQISNVIGNLISSLILGSNINSDNPAPSLDDQYLKICGAAYCNQDLNMAIYRGVGSSSLVDNGSFWNPMMQDQDQLRQSRLPGRNQVYLFCAFCVSCGILAAIVVSCFLDTLPQIDIKEGNDNLTTKQLILGAVRQWKDCKQVLLIPIGLYNGMDNPFWSAEFTKAYITCPIGMHFIGYVMTVYGFTAAIVAVTFGWFSSHRYRTAPFVLAFAVHCGAAITLLYWVPDPNHVTMLFVLSAIWGIGSGVWSSQVPIFYSLIFPNNLEAAFSNTRIWDSVGRTLTYAWSYSLCTNLKIYLVILIVSIGTVGIFAVEIREWILERLEPKRRNELVV